MKLKYEGKDILILHKEIGKGQMPDGRKCRLIMSNGGLSMEVSDKKDKGWKTYTANWMEISKTFADEIIKMEKELSNGK